MKTPPVQANAALALLGFCVLGWPATAHADSIEAFCQLSQHDHTIAVESGPCRFSQRQGNVTVQMGQRQAFRFEANEQGIRYQRDNREDGIRFTRDGDDTLSVYWRQALQCQGPIQAPVSVVYLNQGEQRSAALAVGDQNVLLPVAQSGSGARYSGSGVELWEHQGTTRINWQGTKLVCTS